MGELGYEIVMCFLSSLWMLTYPVHMVRIISKFQLLVFKHLSFIPFFPFSSEEEAKKSMFNEWHIRMFGIAYFLVFIVLLTNVY